MTTAPVTTTSSQIAPPYAGRGWIGLQNNSAATVFLKFDTVGATEATVLDGWQLRPGESLFLDGLAAGNAVFAITSGGGASITLQNV